MGSVFYGFRRSAGRIAAIRFKFIEIPFRLEFASNDLKNDREIFLEAVCQYGSCLRYASNGLKNDRDVVGVAVNNQGNSLEFASDTFKSDPGIVREAVLNNCSAFQFVSLACIGNDECLALVKASYQKAIEERDFVDRFRYMGILRDSPFVERLLEKNWRCYAYLIPKKNWYDWDVLKARFNQFLFRSR